MAFDIASVFNMPSSGTRRKLEIVYIDIDDILDDERNIYRIDEIEELAASIELAGLQQPLCIRPDDEQSGKYRIISGHRRKAALRLLVSEGKTEFRGVPSIIDDDPGSEAMQELKLIFGNSNTRQLSGYELAMQAERVQELFYVLKDEGVEFPGRMRDHVAAFLGTSKSTLSRVKVIMDGLKFESTMKAFQENRLPVSSAYEIARRGEYVQELVDEQLDYICRRSGDELLVILDEMERKAEQDRQMISKMQADNDRLQREAEAAEQKALNREAAEEFLAQRAKDDEKYFSFLREIASDFFERLPAMGISRKLNIAALKREFSFSGASCNDGGYAGGRAGVELRCYSRDFRIDRSWPEFYDMLCAIALNKCAEQVAAKADEPDRPEAGPYGEPRWKTGEPEHDGIYWCKIRIGDVTGHDSCSRLRWDGAVDELPGEWLLLDWKPLDEDVKIIGWWPLPEG